jgi:hypothetical protein
MLLNEWWHSDLIRYRCVRGWCTDYFVKWDIGKTRAMTFATKNDTLNPPPPDSCIARADVINLLGVLIDSKLHFCQRLDCIPSQSRTCLGHIRNIANCLHLLYLTVIKHNFQYTSFPWYTVTASDVRNLERVQWIYVSSCYNSISPMNIWVMTEHFTV